MEGREMIPAEFRELCPESKETLRTYEESCAGLKETDLFRSMKKSEEFFRFFKTCLGSDPWEIQRVWARRILMGTSFAAVAPTGIGKTVLGLTLSLFLHKEGKKSYLLVPTVMLVEQSKELLERYAERAGLQPRIIAYRSSMRKVLTERIKEGDFDILVTTNQFLARNFSLLEDKRFDFIFVDDVDAMLRASKNLDRVLKLLGAYDDERRGVLFIASATGKAGRKTRLLREVLGFDVGVIRRGSIRNVLDVLVEDRTPRRVVDLIRTIGPGGLLFLYKMEILDEVLPALDEAGIRYKVLRGSDPEAVDSFRRGEYDVLIGAAKPYGVLVRGLDLPETVKYAIFYGAPRFEIGVEDVENLSPGMISLMLTLFSSSLGRKALILARKIRRNPSDDVVERGRRIVSEVLERIRSGERFEGVLVTEELKVVIPDLTSYIQGSGRTSRLFRGHLTKGASFLLEERELALYFLKRASIYDIEFTPLDQVDLESLRRELEEDRRRVLERRAEESGELLKHILFIVESPNKARTISRFFGKPSVRNIGEAVVYETSTGTEVLTVVATLGHLVDLTTEEGYHGVLIDDRIIPVYRTIKRCRKCGYQFVDGDRCPICGSEDIRDSKNTVEVLVKLAAESSKILIGTDPDTEGEKIAWDVARLIEKVNSNIYRAEFHEVTRRAILQAIRELKEINENRVKAQIVRRIEDRWIGFELSRKVQEHFGRRNLSAGRAQTPVLGWIVERTKEHGRKVPRSIVRGDGLFFSLDTKLEKGSRKARVRILKDEVVEVNPPPPFTTSELLREANRILKFSSARTMQIAQELFESGAITYHRTDSTRVSDAGLRIAEQLLEKNFVPRKWGEGGAHECIRITRPLSAEELVQLLKEGLFIIRPKPTKDHIKLYSLIYRRFLASQCRKAKVRKVTYEIEIDGLKLVEERFVEVVERGWLEHYPWGLPIRKALPEGEMDVEVKVRKIPAAPLYTQGEVIEEMKRRGIGRPSTYAVLLEKLLMRRYVLDIKGKLVSTKLGKEVYSFLMERYSDLVGEHRTRELEEKMLDVEEGRRDYEEVLREVLREIREKVSHAGSGNR